MRRRTFLKKAGAAAGAALGFPYLIPKRVLGADGRPGANERLTVALIGVGGMGTVHLGNLLEFRKEGRVAIGAVCDADEKRLAKAVSTAGSGVEPYRDYR